MQTILLGLLLGGVYGLLAIGIVLVYKATRVLNFAQAEFGTFAAYMAWFPIMKWGLPWGVGALIALIGIAAIGFVAERYVIRPMLEGPKIAMAVATLGLMSLLGFTEIHFGPRFLRPAVSARGPEVFGVVVSPTRILVIVVAIALGGALWLFLKKTTFGLGLLASADDPVAVRLMGIRMRHLSSFTWVVSALLGGIAGILALSSTGNFEPFAMTARFFVPALAAAIVGGLSSVPGAFAGGLILGLLQAILRTSFTSVNGIEEAGAFALLLLILLLRPQGLFGRTA